MRAYSPTPTTDVRCWRIKRQRPSRTMDRELYPEGESGVAKMT